MPGAAGQPNVVVCGCGPVGTLAAIQAARRGLDVAVYDLRDDLRKPSTTPLNFTKSINLALSERGISAIRDAGGDGLLAEVLRDAIPMHARMIHARNGSGGLLQESQDYDAKGRRIQAVDRGALNKCLLDRLEKMPNVTLRFNHKHTGANFDKKIAWFEQQTPYAGDYPNTRFKEVEVCFDFFVGADGAHSATRFHLMKYARMNYQQEYIDTLWCEFQIKPAKPPSRANANGSVNKTQSALGFDAEARFAISPSHLHIWPAGSFMFIAIPSHDGSFTCTLFAPHSHFAAISKNIKLNLPKFFHTYFPGVCPELISEAELLNQFQSSPHLPLISLKCTPYHYDSSVVIIGDAAHAMVPFYGQGMNAGLEDVGVLFSLLDSHRAFSTSVKPEEQAARRAEALAAYTSQRTPDAHTINDLAMGNYQEMSANVRSPVYKLRKWLEETVSVHLPWTGWRTQYTRVSFENQRYSEVVREVRKQGRILLTTMGLAPLGIGALGYLAWRLRR